MSFDLSQAAVNMCVVAIKLSGTLVGVDSIWHLIVTGLIQSAEIVPNFRDVRVDANGTRIGVQ